MWLGPWRSLIFVAVARGTLMLADVAGYSRYLGGVELEHSRDVLADLIGLIAEQLGQTHEIAKLEGDAVFCFSEGDPVEVATAIESTYFAFARRRRLRSIAPSSVSSPTERSSPTSAWSREV
jgi:hypothetical protein